VAHETPAAREMREYDEQMAALEAAGFTNPEDAARKVMRGEMTFDEILALAKAKKLRRPKWDKPVKTWADIEEKVEFASDPLIILWFSGTVTSEQWDELSLAYHGPID